MCKIMGDILAKYCKIIRMERSSIKKVSIQLEIKVRNTCNIELLRIDIENLCADFVVFKNGICFADLLV